jgi:N-acetylneuraminate lyase
MKAEKISGLIAAPYTPFNSSGGLNLSVIEGYAEYLVMNGVTGVFVCGTTGEWPALSTGERKSILEEWLKCSGGRLRVIAHVGSNDINQCIELAAHAARAGAAATGMIAPSFFKPSDAPGLLSFLAPAAAEAGGKPFYYYHIPSITGVNVQVSELLKIAEESIPNFAGVKFTHSDLFDMQKCIDFDNGRFQVMHGFDEILLCGLALGVTAAVGSTYNYMPSVYLELIDAFSKGDMERARERQLYSVRVVTLLNKYGGSTVAGKAIMKFIGVDCGPNRLPLMTLEGEKLEEFRQDLAHAGFFSI